jgi:uncharacterized protein (TIGR02147 family)
VNSASFNAPEILKGPDLNKYLDYRLYLADFYAFKKQQTQNSLRPYHYGIFAAAANIKSPQYLKLIIEGKRNLSVDMIHKFANALHLNKSHTEEFRLMVLWTQETDPSIRNQHLRDLNEFRVNQSLEQGVIDLQTFKKIPNWIGWIIYAMLDQEGVTFQIEELKILLRQKASENEITDAIDRLVNIGQIVKDEQTGTLKKGRVLVENPEDIPVPLIKKLQTQLMYLGLESLYQDEPTEREFGTLTLCLTKQEFEDLRFQLRKMRKQIHKDTTIKRMSKKGERIYQLNLQLFPVTIAKAKEDLEEVVAHKAKSDKVGAEIAEIPTNPEVKSNVEIVPQVEEHSASPS